MKTKRIIPCLDVRNGRVVKGVQFEDVRDLADPVEMAKFYNASGADELVFYDITASTEGRKLFADVLRRVTEVVDIPLAVGGGISELADFERILAMGAAKISVNSGALRNPALVAEAAKRFGSEKVVLSMDVKRVGSAFHVFSQGGRADTGQDALRWAAKGEADGACELVINSIDNDGVRGGFDLPLLSAMAKTVSIPIIASGGAGKMEDFALLFETVPEIDAGLAAGIFHEKLVTVAALKAFLAQRGIPVRV